MDTVIVSNAAPPNTPNPSPDSRTFSEAEAAEIISFAAEKARMLAETREPKPLVRGELKAAFERLAKEAEAAGVSEAIREQEARERSKRIDALLAGNGIPARYRGASLDDWASLPERIVERAADGSDKAWNVRDEYRQRVQKLARLLRKPGMVALLGKRGPGKTHMACALANAFCGEGRAAVYIDAMDYFIELQETYDDSSRRSQSTVEAKYLRPELLVLDAMEERADTPWNDRMLVRLIDKRYKAELSTVLVSNEEEAAFNDRVGPSIADRIRDDGGKIACPWPSLRGRLVAAASDRAGAA